MDKMNLKGKTLLLMGGAAYSRGIKEYQRQKHFRIVTVSNDPNSVIAKMADVYYHIDTHNIDKVAEVVVKENVDGIFVGASETNIVAAIKVAKKTGVRFYVNEDQWDKISDKASFKHICRKYGVPVIPEYELKGRPTEDDIVEYEYPIVIKPSDGSGAQGLNICTRKEDFFKFYDIALEHSDNKSVIVENYIQNAKEFFVHYTIQDGTFSLSCAFTKFKVQDTNGPVSLPLFHMYPSSYIGEYLHKVDAHAKAMFAALGLKNGNVMLQGFYKNGEFYFYESGYRVGGEQMYYFTDHYWGLNSLNFMINYALTGFSSDEVIAEKDNANFPSPCCNYYVVMKPGVIMDIKGIEKIKAHRNVLNVTEICKEGDVVTEVNALDVRVGFRIHVVGANDDDLAKTLVEISQTLRIISTEGYEMQMEPLTYDRCINLIRNK